MQFFSTILILLVALALLLVACAPATRAAQIPTLHSDTTPMVSTPHRTLKGTFENQITDLENEMPLAKSEGYVIPPAEAQADFAQMVNLIGSGDLVHAEDLAAANQYTLSDYQDRGDGNTVSYLLLEEKPIRRGWGLYAFRKNSTSNIVIEAPHPRTDKRTPSVALDLYRALRARALLVAGAHRRANQDGSADVAHASESIFQSVHVALVQDRQETIVLQIHGFHSTKHAGYPDVVIGLGTNALPKEIALADRIQEALTRQGITAGICLGDTLKDLCAETNIQNAVTEKASFLHIELDENLRGNDRGFIAALTQVFHD